MATKPQHISITALLGFLLAECIISHSAMGQAVSAQQSLPTSRTAQVQPLSLPHLYWHFLIHLNHLDTKATELTAQGKDGSALHEALQKKSGLSDVDFASVRTASIRLAAKLDDLNAQAAAIRTSGSPLSSDQLEQLRVLMDQRQTAINFEIAYLKQNLSPDKIKAFEAFLAQFYSPSNAITSPPLANKSSVPAAVQK